MASDEVTQQLVTALQQYPQSPQQAIDLLRPVADGGDTRAQALLAYWMGSQGQWQEGIPYAQQAVSAGATYLAQFYGQNLIGQGDEALQRQAIEFLSSALDQGLPIDPMAHAQQLAQAGHAPEAVQLLQDAVSGPPSALRRRWEELLATAGGELDQIKAAATAAATERDRVLQEMQRDREQVAREREAVARLAQEVGGFTADQGAKVLADDYGNRAQTIEERANRYTAISIWLGAGIVVAAVVLGIAAALSNNGFQAALEKAAFAIPLLALNFYFARLAANYREEAVRWRHIELQIRTANPFLGALDEDRRKAVLAMLALRFFPGQPLPVPAHASEPPDVAEALGALLAASGSRPPSPAAQTQEQVPAE